MASAWSPRRRWCLVLLLVLRTTTVAIFFGTGERKESRAERAQRKANIAARKRKLNSFAWRMRQAALGATNATTFVASGSSSQYERSALVGELYESLVELDASASGDTEATCVRTLSGRHARRGGAFHEPPWRAYDDAVSSHLATHGFFVANGGAPGCSTTTTTAGSPDDDTAEKAPPEPWIRRGVVTAENDGGLATLRGAHGAFATTDIPANACLGQYVGDEMLDVEFHAHAEGAEHKWHYAMHVSYAKGPLDRTFRRFVDVRRDPTKERLAKVPLSDLVVIVSPHRDDNDTAVADHSSSIMSGLPFVNDCREDMSSSLMTQADDARKNAEFVYCDVQSALFPFLVTTRPIDAGEQIFAYYGAHFLLPPDEEPSPRHDL